MIQSSPEHEMNICELFLSAAKKYPERIALIDKNQSISYKTLEQEVIQTASIFRKKGIKKGDRVLVFIPMCRDLYRVVLALFYLGATAVFLDEWVNKKRMELCCEIADCKGFIAGFKVRFLAIFSKELRQIPIKLNLKLKPEKGISLEKAGKDHPALITFTTGSTGRPKAANRTHGFLFEQFKALNEKIDPSVSDVDMPVLPIVLFMNLGIGCTSVIADFSMSKPEKMNCALITSQIIENKINRITASPFFIQKLAEYIRDNSIEIPTIKKIFTGGSPVFPKQAGIFKQGFPEAEIMIVYGSTEVEPISSITADDLIKMEFAASNGLHVGKPYYKTAIKIIKILDAPIECANEEDLNLLEQKQGEIGEIIVSGPHVLNSYYNSPGAFKSNKIIIQDRIWHRTGDSGKILDGELFLAGRCSQLIWMENEIISPFILEDQLQQIDGITAGTILQKEDEIILVVESQLNPNVLESLLSHIPHDQIIRLTKLPRDPRHNSKLDYKKLEEEINL